MKRRITVVGAVIRSNGRILCAQRGPHGSLPGLWEFPGGKVEPGETARAALEREIAEELRCEVEVGERVVTTEYEYDFGVVSLTTFYCALINGSPTLTEHAQVRWLTPEDLRSIDWAPADIAAVDLLVATATSHDDTGIERVGYTQIDQGKNP